MGPATGGSGGLTPAARRMAPRLLSDLQFRRYWSAQTISMFGDQISGIAIPLAAVLVLHADAADMGYLTALVWLPSLLFGVHAGAWVDRRGARRKTMIAADLGRFALLATLPVSYALGALTLVQLFVVAFAVGLLGVFFNVANAALFVAVTPGDEYLSGNSLIYTSRALSFVAGPSIGGLLVQLLSALFAVAANALSYVGSALFLHRIRPAEPRADLDGKGALTTGAKFIARSPIMRDGLIAVAIVNFFNLMFSALYMLYAVRELHLSAGLIGAVMGAAAVGGVLGAAVIKRLADRIGVGWGYAAGCLVFTAPLLLVPLAAGPKPLVVAMLFAAEFLSGFGVMLLDISFGAIAAAVVPNEVRSRVSGAFQAVNYGTRPVGALLGGFLGAQLGLRPALWIAAAGGVAGFLWLLPSRVLAFRMPSASAPSGTDAATAADAAVRQDQLAGEGPPA